jgi:hypothetical protein
MRFCETLENPLFFLFLLMLVLADCVRLNGRSLESRHGLGRRTILLTESQRFRKEPFRLGRDLAALFGASRHV